MIKKITILKPKKSLNFSESINAGVKASKNDKVFVANDDIIISKQTIEVLAEKCNENTITGPDSNCNLGWLTDKAYQVWGPAGDLIHDNECTNIDTLKLVPAMSLDQVKKYIPEIYKIRPDHTHTSNMDWLAFFATMIHRKCFDDVGMLDENFVYDKEDLDWCKRAAEKGKQFLYCWGSYCFHFGGVSRKVKHKELGLKHDLDTEHNETYFKQKYKEKLKPIVAFYCHDAWEFWDERSIDSSVQDDKPHGIGGSETQVILLAREFSKLGYKVKIFNKCEENHMDTGGDYDVEYIPFQDFANYSKRVTYDYFIASRYLDCFDVPFSSKRNFAMIHDVFLIMNGRSQYDVKSDRIEKYFCLSNRHKQFVSEYHRIDPNKIVMTANGLDFGRFGERPTPTDSYKMIYSSSPDRGLEILLDLFPRIQKEVPEVTLDIFYGFENFRNQDYVSKMMGRIHALEGVSYHGRISQKALARKFQEAAIWSYPTWFEETFSITALEAMAGGAVILTSEYWGLIDTVKDAGIMLPMNDDRNTVRTPEYQDRYVAECVKLLNDRESRGKWLAKGYERVKKFTWAAVAEQLHRYWTTGEWKEIQ